MTFHIPTWVLWVASSMVWLWWGFKVGVRTTIWLLNKRCDAATVAGIKAAIAKRGRR